MQRHKNIPRYFARKAWMTRVLAAILLVITAPMMLLLIVVVRCTSSGPGLFRQSRTGKNGKEFKMYKIRTMYEDAESVTGPTWCVKGDSRVTPVGKVFRLLHFDELPQLINVARGEMDLIGPRPERPVFVAWLAHEIPNYTDRLRVLPGVTGLAQINLPPDETIGCVRKKLLLDCEYIWHANLSMDLRILMCTFLRMIGIRHGRAARWLGVRYTVDTVEIPQKRDSTSSHMDPLWADDINRHAPAHAYANNGKKVPTVMSVECRAVDEIPSVGLEEMAVSAIAVSRRPR